MNFPRLHNAAEINRPHFAADALCPFPVTSAWSGGGCQFVGVVVFFFLFHFPQLNAPTTSASYFLSLIDAHACVVATAAPLRGCFFSAGPYLPLIGLLLL